MDDNILDKLSNKVAMLKINVTELERMLEEIYSLKNLVEVLNEIVKFVPELQERED